MNGRTITVRGLRKSFTLEQGIFFGPGRRVRAVDGISFGISPGESFGLLGESGSGKTTAGKLALGLYPADSGEIYFSLGGEPVDILRAGRRQMKKFRACAQMISQDPYESLNPRMTVFDIVTEPLVVHGRGSRGWRMEKALVMLEKAGITPPRQYIFRYPHELSGGQRQRVSIARALILEPSFIVADEPTSMLDVSIRAGIMELLSGLNREFNLAVLFITHDFAVARHMCARIAVMYAGKILETGDTRRIIERPAHPYTRALLDSVPVPDPTFRRKRPAAFELADAPGARGDICRFFDRCPRRDGVCARDGHPRLREIEEGRFAACRNV